MKNRFVYILCIVMIMVSLSGCSKDTGAANNPTADVSRDSDKPVEGTGEPKVYKLSFKETVASEKLKELNGREVTINGYMATSSPADGSFIFLMNLPYQNCPYCVPNTSQLANTLEVYPKDGTKFEYTGQAVTVTGTFEAAEDGKMFSDNYGYEFAYKLTDAEYHIMTEEDMLDNDSMKAYQKLADSGLIGDLYNMFDYLYFMTSWTEYYQTPFTDMDGTEVAGYWFYPGDMEQYKAYYYADITDNYWKDLKAKAGQFNEDGKLDKLLSMIDDAERLCYAAQQAFDNEEWTTETRYWDEISGEETKYTYTTSKVFNDEYDGAWNTFCDFINSYEL